MLSWCFPVFALLEENRCFFYWEEGGEFQGGAVEGGVEGGVEGAIVLGST